MLRNAARACLLVALALTVCAYPQNAPGNLPWGTDPNAAPQQPPPMPAPSSGRPELAEEFFRHVYGTVSFGFEHDTSDSFRAGDEDFGLTLNGSGYLLDPRLWSQTLSFEMDQSDSSTGYGSRGLGFNLDGTLLGRRSFPLHLNVSRRSNDASISPIETATRSDSVALDWMLRQPKILNIQLAARFGGASQDAAFSVLPYDERERGFSGVVSRNLDGWFFMGSADYSRVHTSLQEFINTITRRAFQVDRRLRNGGDFRTSVQHLERSDSRFGGLPMTSSLDRVDSAFFHRHTRKLRGFYGLTYLSDLTTAAIAAAVQSATGLGQAPPVNFDSALGQALLSNTKTSSLNTSAGWDYQMTPALSLGLQVGHTLVNPSQSITLQQPFLLDAYTGLGGNVGYRRQLGKWETLWHAGWTHHWNHVVSGIGYPDDSRAVEMGLGRKLRSWRWTSSLSYSDYNTGARYDTPLYAEERWINTLQSRLENGLRFDLGADVLHYDSSRFSVWQRSSGQDTAVLLHGTISGRRATLTGGTGIRNVNSTLVALDIANPLNTVLLSQFTPLATSMSAADHYSDVYGTYRRRRMSFQAGYRRDTLELLQGTTTYAGMDFSVTYGLRRLSIVGGYQRERQLTLPIEHQRSRFYIMLRRPFRVY